MQSSVLCGVRVNMMERRPLVAIGRKATDRIRDRWTGVVWIIVMFLSAVWTLILTAPIHCRASIAETLMQRHISTNLMKKQTHSNLR